MAISGKMRIKLALNQTGTADLSSPEETLPTIDFVVTDGAGAGEMDLLWSDQRTLSASATEDLDLYGSLVDSFGTTMSFTRMRLLVVKAADDNTNNVVIGGAAANTMLNWVSDATDKVVVKPGGILYLYAPDTTGYAVTSGTGDLLTITNGGAGSSVTYDIYIGGGSS